MKKLRFYKEDGKWYIDLPQWLGSKADLQMVAGADTMLDGLSSHGANVSVFVSQKYKGDIALKLKEELGIGGGANYTSDKADYNIWLCDVTKFVFGKFPKNIYITKTT